MYYQRLREFKIFKGDKMRIHFDFREEVDEILQRVNVEIDIYIDGGLVIKDFDLYSYLDWTELTNRRCQVINTYKELEEAQKKKNTIVYIYYNRISTEVYVVCNGERVINGYKLSDPELWEYLLNDKNILVSWG